MLHLGNVKIDASEETLGLHGNVEHGTVTIQSSSPFAR